MSASITVKFFATLGRFSPERPDGRHPIGPETTVIDVLTSLGVPLTDARLVFINNKKGELTDVLKPGDRLAVFPPVGGG